MRDSQETEASKVAEGQHEMEVILDCYRVSLREIFKARKKLKMDKISASLGQYIISCLMGAYRKVLIMSLELDCPLFYDFTPKGFFLDYEEYQFKLLLSM